MQIKVITIPVTGGEAQNEELNALLKSQKILQVEQQLIAAPQGAMWCFCVRYTEDFSPYPKKKGEVDYRTVLDPDSFARFAKMREIRKQVADQEGVRPFVVFSNAELAELAKQEVLTRALMLQVKGIGEQKVAKYAAYFIKDEPDAQSK